MKVKELNYMLRRTIKMVVCSTDCYEGKKHKRVSTEVKEYSGASKFVWVISKYWFEGEEHPFTDVVWSVLLGPRGGIYEAWRSQGRDRIDMLDMFRGYVRVGSSLECSCRGRVRNGEYDWIDDIEIEMIE